MAPCMLMGVVSWQPPFFSNWKVKSNESELENGPQIDHRHRHFGLHLARGFLSGNQRHRAEERVVDAHLHAGDGADGNRIVAIDQLQHRIGPVGVEDVRRNAEVDIQRRGSVALQLVGGGVIPQRDRLVGARPARRRIGLPACRAA